MSDFQIKVGDPPFAQTLTQVDATSVNQSNPDFCGPLVYTLKLVSAEPQLASGSIDKNFYLTDMPATLNLDVSYPQESLRGIYTFELQVHLADYPEVLLEQQFQVSVLGNS